jgi:hypothetical protein
VEISSPSVDNHGERSVAVLGPRGGTPAIRWDSDPWIVVSAVARRCDLSPESVRSGARSREVVRARRLALLAWIYLGRDQKTMAAVLGISEAAASMLVRDRAACAALDVIAQTIAEKSKTT